MTDSVDRGSQDLPRTLAIACALVSVLIIGLNNTVYRHVALPPIDLIRALAPAPGAIVLSMIITWWTAHRWLAARGYPPIAAAVALPVFLVLQVVAAFLMALAAAFVFQTVDAVMVLLRGLSLEGALSHVGWFLVISKLQDLLLTCALSWWVARATLYLSVRRAAVRPALPWRLHRTSIIVVAVGTLYFWETFLDAMNFANLGLLDQSLAGAILDMVLQPLVSAGVAALVLRRLVPLATRGLTVGRAFGLGSAAAWLLQGSVVLLLAAALWLLPIGGAMGVIGVVLANPWPMTIVYAALMGLTTLGLGMLFLKPGRQ
ncbi:hypothetical protein ACILG0_09345 [Pseudomonadota bacterium AL_CKDN230030165-1A_HGKHYDSX7]